MTQRKTINLPEPELQVSFAFALERFRSLHLQRALLETVRQMDITEIDSQLAAYVTPNDLRTLAQHGLRGELLFAVPAVLRKNPHLLGYYRLLMGYSQKEFYGTSKGFGVSHFKSSETKGKLSEAASIDLDNLCSAFCRVASNLLNGLSSMQISRDLLNDLTLLTVGPQLRGGANNRLGNEGIIRLLELINEIVQHASTKVSATAIKVNSASGRPVWIEVAADPDIIFREEMEASHYRNVVAIEVKSGTDASNIHNRIGEAEKSHQKARRNGYTECWTVVNVDRLDRTKAKEESPSTDRFYSLALISQKVGDEYEDFRRRVLSLTAIAAGPPN